MKRILILLIFFLTHGASIFAQGDSIQSASGMGGFLKHTEISAIVGAGGAKIRSSGDEGSSYVTGLNVRVSVDRWLHRSWAFSYGVEYSQQGSEGMIEEGYKHLVSKHRYHYVGIPLMAKWRVFKKGNLIVSFGFRPDFMVAATETYRDFDADYSRSIRMNRVDCKFQFDMSYVFKSGIIIGFEKGEGLLNVGNVNFIGANTKSKISSTYFHLGYRLYKN